MNNKPFPWNHYIRSFRSRISYIALAYFGGVVIHNNSQSNFAVIFLIYTLILILINFIHSYFRINPFRDVLQRMEKLQEKLPHNKQIELIYEKNEWNLINDIIDMSESHIENQVKSISSLEEQSETLLKNIPEGIVIVDKFLTCKNYNLAFKEQFIKKNKISITKEEKLWMIFADEKLLDHFKRSILKDKNITQESIHFSDTNKFYNLTITPIHDNEGLSVGALGIFHNITNFKLSEKMRVDFVANVSHEIKTPLTSIKGYSQLLLAQKDLKETHTNLLNKIVNNSERLKDLFEKLIQLSKIETQFDINFESIDLNKLILKIQGQLRDKYLDKNFKVETFLDEDSLKADYQLLEMALANLFDNAIKYGKGLPIVQVKTKVENSYLKIQIHDNGPGIKDDELDRIFERFYRVQGSSSEVIEGSGIGLSIVKHVVNKHKGHINVYSNIGLGTTFEIFLPRDMNA